MIEITKQFNEKPFNLSEFDYYIFTSKNGVNSFFNLYFVKGKFVKAICLGEKTKDALLENGIEPVFLSNKSYDDNLINELLENQIITKKKILLVLGNLSDDKIEERLSSICNVKRINVYNTNLETKKNEDLTDLLDNRNTISIFTSPSSFQAFNNLYNAEKTVLVSIGTTTSKSIKSLGFFPKIISDKQTYFGVSKSIINYYKTKNIRI
jgi:uroporphyrinogen-III synthase